MRRSKNKTGAVKALTTAAAIAAITAGSIGVYASPGAGSYDWIEVGGRRIRIETLENDPTYRERVIEAFLNLDPIMANINGNLFNVSDLSTLGLTPIEPVAPAQPILRRNDARRLIRRAVDRSFDEGSAPAPAAPEAPGIPGDGVDVWTPYGV